jgi:hypothetical protein
VGAGVVVNHHNSPAKHATSLIPDRATQFFKCGMFSIHVTKLTMNFSRFHVLRIQETDYRPHFTCGRILYFLKIKKKNTLRKHCSNVCNLRPCLDKESNYSARKCTIMAPTLQRQYSQTELTFWITYVYLKSKNLAAKVILVLGKPSRNPQDYCSPT